MTTAQNRSPLRSTATMSVGVAPAGTEPIVFAADTEPFDIENPSIVDDLRPQNVFSWSEQHARQFPKKARRHAVGTAPCPESAMPAGSCSPQSSASASPTSDRPRGPWIAHVVSAVRTCRLSLVDVLPGSDVAQQTSPRCASTPSLDVDVSGSHMDPLARSPSGRSGSRSPHRPLRGCRAF